MERVTIIIPVKNRLHLLGQTLENIFHQTYPNIEVIVIDDHSTESLLPIQEKYGTKVTVYKSEGNGPGAARNTGLKYATGNYIQFFDSDDIMTNDKIEVQYNLLKNSNALMAYCPYIQAVEDTNGAWKPIDVFMYYFPISRHKRFDQMVLRGTSMITQCCLFKKEIFQKVGNWRTDVMPHEDVDFIFRVAQVETNPVHTKIPLVIYRQHSKQITDLQTTRQDRLMDGIKVHAGVLDHVYQNKKYTFWDKMIVQSTIYHLARQLSNRKKVMKQYHIHIGVLIFYFTSELFKKVERKRTKSNWTKRYGVYFSQKVWEEYRKKIK